GQPVVIVDEILARRFLGDLDPIGAHLVLDDGVRPREVEIVGVVADVAHFRPEDGPTPTIYVPLDQMPATLAGSIAANASVAVRARPGTRPALDALLAGLDIGVAASVPRPMTDAVADASAARRLSLELVTLVALVALALAATGLAALVATIVGQRTREIGLR